MNFELLRRYRAFVFLVTYLFISTLLMTLRLEPVVLGIKSSIWFLVSPNIVYSGQFFQRFDSLRGRFFRLIRAEAENTILREQVSQLAKNETQRQSLELENARLRDLLLLNQKRFPESIPAEVVARDVQNWVHSVVLNKGESDGVSLSAAVVIGTPQKPLLIGRVTELAKKSCKVLLITDVLSKISVGIVGKPDVGLLEGKQTTTCFLRYLSDDTTIVQGDEVITVGLGGVFPPGIPVGSVIDVSRSEDGFFKESRVRPHAHLGSIISVLILKRTDILPNDTAGHS